MITKLISADKGVVIGATNSTETLASASDVFSSVSPDFKNWGSDKELATPEVAVLVYEQIEDATYPEIFGSVDQNFDRLVLTISQIKNFVVNHAKDYLLEAEWTCFRFLFKEGDEFFVADVRVLSEGKLDFRVTPFRDGSVRHAEYRHRIVVPQLAVNTPQEELKKWFNDQAANIGQVVVFVIALPFVLKYFGSNNWSTNIVLLVVSVVVLILLKKGGIKIYE